MSRIFKSEHFGHIDLDKIVRVGDAYFIDNMGSGGWYVGFNVDVQLRDAPLEYCRELSYMEENGEAKFDKCHLLALTNGTWTSESYMVSGDTKIVAVVNLQKEVDALVEEWKKA